MIKKYNVMSTCRICSNRSGFNFELCFNNEDYRVICEDCACALVDEINEHIYDPSDYKSNEGVC